MSRKGTDIGSIAGRDLGRFGIWTSDFEALPAQLIRATTQRIEQLGWTAVWVPELYGREAVSQAGLLLSCSQELAVVNGIAQIWPRRARATHAAATLLADAYPGRHVLGLGYGGLERPGTSPIAAMGKYLDDMDAAAAKNPGPPVRRILAAYGPKMLALARDHSAGAHTYHVPVVHTEQSRRLLGPERFLGVEQAVLLETDPATARAIAREHLRPYLGQTYNVAKFGRLGYAEADLDGGRGSDRLVDDLVAWGSVDAVVARLIEHLDAGADHVAVQVLDPTGPSADMAAAGRLADALGF